MKWTALSFKRLKAADCLHRRYKSTWREMGICINAKQLQRGALCSTEVSQDSAPLPHNCLRTTTCVTAKVASRGLENNRIRGLLDSAVVDRNPLSLA